jgi:large repetitive protein
MRPSLLVFLLLSACGSTPADPGDEHLADAGTDDVAPDTVIAAAPSGTVATGDAVIAYLSPDADATGFEVRLDGGDWGPASGPPHALTGLAPGEHTVEVRAHDAAGNVDATPAQASWVVDLVGPETVLEGIAEGTYTSDATLEFIFSAPDAARFECSESATGELTACTSPHMLTAPDGARAFRVRAYDAAGNQGPVVSRGFVVDTIAPDFSFAGTPANNTHVRSGHVAVDLTATEEVTFSCAFLPADALSPCAAHFEAERGDGYHTLQVAAYDKAGNNVYRQIAFWVDSSAPTVAISAKATVDDTPIPSGGATRVGVVTFDLATEPGVGLFCKIGQEAFAPCPASRQVSFGSDGPFTFEAYATDDVGAGPVASFPLVLDWQRPNVTFLSTFDTLSCAPGTSNVLVAFDFNEAVKNVKVEWRGTLNAGGTYTTPIELAEQAPDYYYVRRDRPDGALEARVLAEDLVGNTRTSAWLKVYNCANGVGLH